MTRGPLHNAIRDIEALARRARLLILSRRVLGVLSSALGVGAVLVLLDFIFRFPAPLRAMFLGVGIAVMAVTGWRLVRSAWHFRPTATQLALRIERSNPQLAGRLASGIEFALAGTDAENPLAARSVADVARRLEMESVRSWIAPGRSMAEVSTAFFTMAVLVLLGLLMPTHAKIGAERLLTPFSGATWPARTAVESLMGDATHHAKGEALVLAAKLTLGDAPSERITALVAVTRDDGTTETEELVLTRQADGRYERVLEADPRMERIDLRFQSVDAETDSRVIEFVAPPVVASSHLTVRPPTYAEGAMAAVEADLGNGTDERSTVRDTVLVGSHAELTLGLSKPATVRLTEGDDAVTATKLGDGAQWTLGWDVTRSKELRLELVDDLGIRSPDDIRFHVEATEDRPPTAAVIDPASDESVLPTAIIPITFEVRDDVALAKSGIVVSRRVGGRGDPTVATEKVGATTGTNERREERLELGTLQVEPGDVLVVVAVAEDGFALDGARHDRVSSPPRLLRVIAEQELGRQVRAQLSAVRRSAMRLDQQQGELAAATENGRFDPSLERGQAQVSDRLRTAGETVRELAERLTRNGLDDEELAATLGQARDLLEVAGQASAKSSEALQRAREAAAKAASDPAAAAAAEAAAKDASKAQEDVRAELEDLIKLLDRDEDSWAMGRQIDQLRERVDGLAKRTQEVGKRTVGQRAADLKSDDRQELDRIADEQREAAREAQELVDELRKRADSVDRNDKARAEAMREAARAAEERRLERNLEQAGEDVRENRMQQAQGEQQAAAQALDEMRRGLDDVKKARTEELRRALESLERSIERLVKQSEDELINLARVASPEDAEPIAERGRAMAKLAQNTQAVASEARAAGSEAGRIARVLDRAADSQGGAVGFLRSAPAKLEDARSAEERGLTLLREALDAAKATKQQVEKQETERKRRELVAAYRKVLEKQASVKEGTIAARPKGADAKLDRRGLIESRRLAITEGEIGHDVDAMKETHPELAKSEVMAETHALIGRWTSDASTRLGGGDLGDRTTELQQFVMDAIGAVIESLEPEADEDPFQENNGNSQDQQQQGGDQEQQQEDPLVPSLAELKVLRGLQAQLLERTKRLDTAKEGATGDRAAIDSELQALAQTQTRLMEAAQRLVKRLERPKLPKDEGREGGAPVPGPGPEPDPQPDPEPDPRPDPKPDPEPPAR